MSTFELLIAFSIFVLISSVVIGVVFGNQVLMSVISLSDEAMSRAVEKLEEFKIEREHEWAFATTSVSVTEGIFEYQIETADVSPCTKLATSSASWHGGSGELHTRSFSSLVINQTEQRLYGFDCSVVPPQGDWSRPVLTNATSSFSVTELVTSIDALGNLLYVGVNPQSAPGSDFYIVDMSAVDPAVPLGSLNTGPGIAALDATRDLVFAATVSRNAQLQIIDVANPETPFVLSSYKLPGVYTDATVGLSIFYYDSRIYLGTNKSQIGEFHIIDVSDTSNPFELGSYELNAGVNSLVVRDTYAYVATPNNEEVTVLDVSNPGGIQRVGGFDAPGGSGNGKSLALLGNRLYVGRTVGGREFYILDITSPSNPYSLGSYDVNASVVGIHVSNGLAFLATGGSDRLEIMDVQNPAFPIKRGGFSSMDKPTSIDGEDGEVFLSSETGRILTIFTTE